MAVLSEADGAADTAVIGGGGLHERRVRRAGTGRTVIDSRDLLHRHIFFTFRIKSVSEDRIGHFCKNKKHAGMFAAESKMPGTGAVRQTDAAICFPQFAGFAVEFVNIDHVQAEVADQDLISLCVKNSKMRVRSLLPIRIVVTDAAVAAKVAERTERAIRIQIIEGDRPAAVTCDQKKLPARIDTDVAGTSAGAGQAAQDSLILNRVDGCAVGSLPESIQYFARGECQVGGIGDLLHRAECRKGL